MCRSSDDPDSPRMCISVDLPGPRWTGDGDELSGFDVEVGAAKRADGDFADVVRLDEIAN